MPLFYNKLDINILKNEKSSRNMEFLLNGTVFNKYLKYPVKSGYVSVKKLMKLYLSTNLTRVLILKEMKDYLKTFLCPDSCEYNYGSRGWYMWADLTY